MPPRSILGRCRPARELTSRGAVRIRANGAAAMRPSRLRPWASAVLGQERRAMIPRYSDPMDRADQGRRRNKPIQRAAPRSAIQNYRAATAAISLIERDLPVDLQITGEEDDPTTTEFALPFATEIDGFVPPPAGLPPRQRAGQRCGADATISTRSWLGARRG